MRRYSVRFLVALLTFGIGVALTLVFGLIAGKHRRVDARRWEFSSCRRQIRLLRPPFLSIDSQPNEPLKISYLGAAPDRFDAGKVRMRFLVENRSDQTVSAYSVTCKKGWGANKVGEEAVVAWYSNDVLRPGESQSITFSWEADEALTLRLETARFQNGSAWNPPAFR